MKYYETITSAWSWMNTWLFKEESGAFYGICEISRNNIWKKGETTYLREVDFTHLKEISEEDYKIRVIRILLES